MKTSDSIKQIAPALVAAQAELENVPKDATNPHFKNTYATLGAIIESTKPVLVKHGLAVIQGLGELQNGAIQVTTRILHGPSAEWIETTMSVPLTKQDAQGAGSASTYGRRYALAALLGLTQVDDDGEEASRQPERRQQQSKPAAGKAPAAAPAEAPSKDHRDLARLLANAAEVLEITQAEMWKSVQAWCQEHMKFTPAKVTALNPVQIQRVAKMIGEELAGSDGSLQGAVTAEEGSEGP